MRRKRRKPKPAFKEIYTPYKVTESETLDEEYQRYLEDPEHIVEKDGRTYFRIVHAELITLEQKERFLVVLDRKLWDKKGDILLDEEGREFTITRVQMLCFRNGIPMWYSHLDEVILKGDTKEIGHYLSRKEQDEQ